MKRCPHCSEDSFGIRELFGLYYFGADECKSCGKLVRNDGLRQFLVIPTAILTVLLCVPLFSILPESAETFFLPLCFLLIVLPQLALAKPVKADYPKSRFRRSLPDPKNDKTILVDGWNEEELRKIVAGFIGQDRTDLPQFKVEINKRLESSFCLTFPEDIPPSDFASLVNYLAHPIDFGLGDRSIVVAGKTTLNADFAGIPEALVGKKAVFYLPEGDQDYDGVYLQTETGMTFASSLGHKMIWRQVTRPRMGNDVRELSLEALAIKTSSDPVITD